MLETAHPFVRARRVWYARDCDWLTRETGVSGTDARHVFGAGREKADRAYEETAVCEVLLACSCQWVE